MRKKEKNAPTVADFFAGAGGFSEGFRQAGFDVVFALDNWKPAVETHRLNHPGCEASLTDILELTDGKAIDEVVPDTDVIIGSPPCVAFSGSNKAGKADKTLGVQLIEAYLRVIAWKRNKEGSRLKGWVLENVPNSAGYVKDEYTFEELGLKGGKRTAIKLRSKRILNAADFGAPQTRTRFFGGDYDVPEPTVKEPDRVTMRTVMDALSDPLARHHPRKVTDPLYGFDMLAGSLTDHFYDTTVAEFEWRSAKRLKVDHGFMGRMSFPESLDRPSRTIMATRSSSTREAVIFGGVSDGKGGWESYRMPTIREIASFMSFPITYQFEGSNESVKYRLVGNAVCPLMAKAIAERMMVKLGHKPRKLFPPLPDVRPSVDLTGSARESKEQGTRKPDARFAMHIPGMKLRSMRVELSNMFESGRVEWRCVLHWGSGKNAKAYAVDQKRLDRFLSSRFIDGYEEFKGDVEASFDKEMPDAKTFQRLFCRLENGARMGPEEALEQVRELIDERFPPEEHDDEVVGGVASALGIDVKDEVPLRILMGAYAVNHLVSRVMRE